MESSVCPSALATLMLFCTSLSHWFQHDSFAIWSCFSDSCSSCVICSIDSPSCICSFPCLLLYLDFLLYSAVFLSPGWDFFLHTTIFMYRQLLNPLAFTFRLLLSSTVPAALPPYEKANRRAWQVLEKNSKDDGKVGRFPCTEWSRREISWCQQGNQMLQWKSWSMEELLVKFVQVKFTDSEQTQVSPSVFQMLFIKLRVEDLTLYRSLYLLFVICIVIC